MTEPIDYGQRAANQPKPIGWPKLGHAMHSGIEHSRAEAEQMEATALSFFADWSSYQPVLTKAYPYGMTMFRADTGYETDTRAAANHKLASGWDQIQVEGAYCVYKDNDASAALTRLRNLFGSQPDPKLVIMTDMESGVPWFAGPGNHSSGANAWLEDVAAWLGKLPQLGYANAGDWANNWPQHPADLKRSLANYSANPTPHGYFARQYYGALKYPVPAGYPTSCKPFGTYIDMNVIPLPLAEVAAAFGIGDALVAVTQAEFDALTAKVSAIYDALLGHDGHHHQVETLAAMGGGNMTVAQAHAQGGKLAAEEPK